MLEEIEDDVANMVEAVAEDVLQSGQYIETDKQQLRDCLNKLIDERIALWLKANSTTCAP